MSDTGTRCLGRIRRTISLKGSRSIVRFPTWAPAPDSTSHRPRYSDAYNPTIL